MINIIIYDHLYTYINILTNKSVLVQVFIQVLL